MGARDSWPQPARPRLGTWRSLWDSARLGNRVVFAGCQTHAVSQRLGKPGSGRSAAITAISPNVRNCAPPLAKISDFSGRFEQARQHSGNNGESNREQNEPVEMVRYVKVRKREPRRDFDKGVSNY